MHSANLVGERLAEVRRGRSFCFSPAWLDEGASLVFDRNSGDFWVVPDISRCVLLTLGASRLSITDLAQKLADDRGILTSPEAFSSLLDELAAAGLIMQRSA